MTNQTPTQKTLTGESTNKPRTRPDTLVKCPECETLLLRSERHDHPHDVIPWSGFVRSVNDPNGVTDDETDEDPEPMKMGNWFDITVSYSVDYRFRVPGYDRHDAESIAKAMAWDADPNEHYHVHTDARELDAIYDDDEETIERLDSLERGV